MNEYKQLRRFLSDKGCEREFDRAFYAQNGCCVFDPYLADLIVIDESFFGRIFDWSKTPEGRPFWKHIDAMWWDYFSSFSR